MKLTEVQNVVGFADGEILGCERIDSTFVVRVRAWNSKPLRVEFKDAQLVLDLMPRDISGFYCYDEETELMRKALNYAYDEPPKQHAYKHFAFMNNDGEPCLEIVAAETEVIFE
jgi:hypothetical protein